MILNNQKRRALKKDFVKFMIYMFGRMGLPHPTPMQILFADILQHEKSPRIILLAYRGFAKTTIANLWLLWEQWRDPKRQQAIWGQNLDFAASSVAQMLNWVQTFHEFELIKPGPRDRQSTHGYDTPFKPAHVKGSTVNALSIGGSITGSRADDLLIDDPETQHNGYTQQKRENLDRAMSEATMVIKQGTGRIRILGTPHFDRSLYTRLKEKGYKIYIFPMSVPPNDVANLCWQHYPKQIRDRIEKGREGDPLDRFTPEDIAMRMSEGKITYERQCLLNLYRSSGSRRDLDITRIILYDANPDMFPARLEHAREPQYVDESMSQYSCADIGEKFYRPFKVDEKMIRYDWKVAFIDPAGDGKDELALQVGGAAGGYFVLFHSEGMGGLTKENIERCIDKALELKVDEICVESNLGTSAQWVRAVMDEKYATRFGRKNLPVVTPIHNQTAKKVRIEALDGIINRGVMVITPGALIADHTSAADRGTMDFTDYTLTAQISNFSTKDDLPFDDRIDALAGLAKRLAPWLNVTPEKNQMDREFEYIESLFKGPDHAVLNQVLPEAPPSIEEYHSDGRSFRDVGSVAWR